MPKIKQEMDIGEDDEELEEEEEGEDFEDEEEDVYDTPKRKPERIETRGRKPKQQPQQEEVKRRFGIIAPTQLRIVDTETNELVGEGDFAVIQALTDILERLERIEVQIGAVTGQ